jgi:hypothetical protein
MSNGDLIFEIRIPTAMVQKAAVDALDPGLYDRSDVSLKSIVLTAISDERSSLVAAAKAAILDFAKSPDFALALQSGILRGVEDEGEKIGRRLAKSAAEASQKEIK